MEARCGAGIPARESSVPAIVNAQCRFAPRGFRRRRGAAFTIAVALLLLSFSPAVLPAEGIDSPIKTIYLVAHAHLDIGYTNPPRVVEEEYKTRIDQEIAFAKAHPDFKWNIEETWQLRQWMQRSSPEEVDALMMLIREGRFGLGGAHSTLHSAKAGIEELSRLLYDAEWLRRDYRLPIHTVFHNDSPGLPWSYPQTLAGAGIRHLVVGLNLFIGGGFDAPYHPYLFHWEGPDGSRVLTWVTWNGYYEATARYGFARRKVGLDRAQLEKALREMVESGYPYDAVMVQCSEDNSVNAPLDANVYESARQWNASNDNPRIVMARPEDFFEHILATHPEIPVLKGDWTSPWDTMQMVEPQSETFGKIAQDRLPGVEALCALATTLTSSPYPRAEFDRAWDHLLTIDEHSGGDGLEKRGGATQEEVDQTGDYFYDKVLDAQRILRETEDAGAKALFARFAGESPAVVVFNPLSWTRSGVVRIPLRASDATENAFRLIDPETSDPIAVQLESADGQTWLSFVAQDVPGLGVKRFTRQLKAKSTKPKRATEPKPKRSTSTTVSPSTSAATVLENRWFRLEVAGDGTVRSLVERATRTEWIAPSDFVCGSLWKKTNTEYFMGADGIRVDAVGPVSVSKRAAGPVSRSVVIRREASPLSELEIVLYDDAARVDVVATVNRDAMEAATLDENALVYSLAFPLDFPFQAARLDTPAGVFHPVRDTMKGAQPWRRNLQHGIHLGRDDAGVAFVAPDVYTHDLRPAISPDASSTGTLILSNFIRKIDLHRLKGDTVGRTNVEPGAPRRWVMRFSFVPLAGDVHPVAEQRAAWQLCDPLIGGTVGEWSGPDAPVSASDDSASVVSLLAVDSPSVAVFSLKAANIGDGIIVKLRETGGVSAIATLSSTVFMIHKAQETNRIEGDLGNPPLPIRNGKVNVSLRPNEIKCLRLALVPTRDAEVYLPKTERAR